jgi:preprotein translocase subunit SecA
MAEIEPRKAKRSREAGRLTALLVEVLPVLEQMTRALRNGGGPDDVVPPAGLIDAIAGKTIAASKPAAPQIGRNDPCPCGSGQKYKRCCGAAA